MQVISQHRFGAGMQRLKQAIDDGALGKLVMGNAEIFWYRAQAYYDSGGWRGTWALDGGGCLMNQGVHYVDLLRWAMGPVTSVTAKMGTLAHERIEVEDAAVAVIQFANGAIGSLIGTTDAFPGYTCRLEIVGTEGSVILEDGEIKAWNLQVRDGRGRRIRAQQGGEEGRSSHEWQGERPGRGGPGGDLLGRARLRGARPDRRHPGGPRGRAARRGGAQRRSN